MYTVAKKDKKVKSWHKMARKRRRLYAKEQMKAFLSPITPKRVFGYALLSLFLIEVGAQVSIFILTHAS